MDISDIKSRTKNTCTVCGKQADDGIDLPAYPITELYEDFSQTFVKKGLFDQRFSYCSDCHHGFLSSVLDVGFIYENYMTHSTGSWGAEKCLLNFQTYIQDRVNVDDFDTVVDIGGNDSYFLNLLDGTDLTKVNIDPNASGDASIVLERCFFENMDLKKFKNDKKLIVSSHTIEHVEDPNVLIAAIAESMGTEDVCFIQMPSLESLVNDLRFDQICHQHLNTFSVRSMHRLLKRHGLSLVDFEFDGDHFGTLRVMARKHGDQPSMPIHGIENFAQIFERYQVYRNYLNALGTSLNLRAGPVSGFGAGLMVPTLAYSMPSVENLRCLYDDNPDKIGKRFVNLNVEIRPTRDMQPNETILLASISTKLSARAIVNKLLDQKVENLIIPNLTF